jgi:hypothetical protein
MVSTGLHLLYNVDRIRRANNTTNIRRFASKFGVHPVTACTLYGDLQKTTIETARIVGEDSNLRWLLITLYFLMKYPERDVLESEFNFSRGYISNKIWTWIKRIRDMKAEKIVFPSLEELGDSIWIMTVDGVDFMTREPTHPEFSRDRKNYSQKFNRAGKSYEFGVSLTGGLIWMNGPFRAGTNDLNKFRSPGGLRDKLEQLGKKCISDQAYRGERELCSFYNSEDSKSVAMFKSRALLRQETIHGTFKTFNILSGMFRHSEDQFGYAVEAVAVVTQYKLENELPLFDILIPAVLQADEDDDSSDEEQESSNEEQESSNEEDGNNEEEEESSDEE